MEPSISPNQNRRRARSGSFGKAATSIALLATTSQVKSFSVQSTPSHKRVSQQRPRASTISEGCSTLREGTAGSSLDFRSCDKIETGDVPGIWSWAGMEQFTRAGKHAPFFSDIISPAINELREINSMGSTFKENLKVPDELPPWLSRFSANTAASYIESLRLSLRYLTSEESKQVLLAIHSAADGDGRKVAGASEFCRILADTMEMGVDSLVAAAFHFTSCVSAREQGQLSEISDVASPVSEDSHINERLEEFGPEAVRIAAAAASLKRVERVAGSVIGFDSTSERSKRTRAPMDRGAAAHLRSMLLSVTNDWRALAIRSAACLFRLRGLEETRQIDSTGLSPVEVYTSREAIYLYSPLAHRLGFFSLKSELDRISFRTLYKKQHSAVLKLTQPKNSFVKPNASIVEDHRPSSVSDEYGFKSHAMTIVLDDVTRQVKTFLQNDIVFMDSISSVSVSARVKEPFSLWRKMLKLRARRVEEARDKSFSDDGEVKTDENIPLSVADVPDAVALRVILKARKLTPKENDEVTSARERALCYYVQKLIADTWPDSKNSKDYIRNPKPNGYQSLHYNTKARWHGQDWKFETQVRTSSMHRVAEYGVAAHFDYKALRGGSKLDHTSDAYLKSVEELKGKKTLQPPSLGSFSLDPTIDWFPRSREQLLRDDRVKARDEEIAPYLQAFSKSQTDIVRELVFVFVTPSGSKKDGKILCLPNGARVIDALNASEKISNEYSRWRIEDQTGIYMNGSASSITSRLSNGDVLIVPVFENQN